MVQKDMDGRLSDLSDEELEKKGKEAWEKVADLELKSRILRDLGEEKYFEALEARRIAWGYFAEHNRRQSKDE